MSDPDAVATFLPPKVDLPSVDSGMLAGALTRESRARPSRQIPIYSFGSDDDNKRESSVRIHVTVAMRMKGASSWPCG